MRRAITEEDVAVEAEVANMVEVKDHKHHMPIESHITREKAKDKKVKKTRMVSIESISMVIEEVMADRVKRSMRILIITNISMLQEPSTKEFK